MKIIAIVDKKRSTKFFYKITLEPLGYKIGVIANDVNEALTKLKKEKIFPNIFIIDDITSVATIKENIKNIRISYPEIKIVVISEDDSIQKEIINSGTNYRIKALSLSNVLSHSNINFQPKRSRGRPEVPSENKKTRVTFSITKKVIDDFNLMCEYNKEDTNRIMEKIIIEHIEKQNSIITKAQKLYELNQKQIELEKEIETLEKEISIKNKSTNINFQSLTTK